MAATPKTRKSDSRSRTSRAHKNLPKHTPQLQVTSAGKRVPTHMVTPDNPSKKGVKFLRSLKKRK